MNVGLPLPHSASSRKEGSFSSSTPMDPLRVHTAFSRSGPHKAMAALSPLHTALAPSLPSLLSVAAQAGKK